MSLLKLIPQIFYADINVGLSFFTEGLGFKVLYKDDNSENPFYIIERDNVVIYLIGNEEYALKDRPQIRIETDDIEAYYAEIKTRKPELLHPNLNKIKAQPWGLKEFALLDETTVCVVIHQKQ